MAFYSEEEISKYAFPAVVEEGRRWYQKQKVISSSLLGDNLIASVRDEATQKVVISRDSEAGMRFECSCGFDMGGACKHAVAAMFSANESNAVQVGINWDNLPPADDTDDDERAESEQRTSDLNVGELPLSKPVGRLYLTESESMLLVELRFHYNGLAEFSRTDSNQSRIVLSESGKLVKVTRSRARETVLTAKLASYNLVRYQAATFTPDCDPRIWTLQELPRLARDGFEIYGQEKLISSNARKSTPKLNVVVTTKEGVFECALTVKFDGISATLASLLQAVREGSRFVLLSDGSSGMLPQSWLDKFSALFSAINETENKDRLLIKSSQIALVDMLFSMADKSEGDCDFLSKRERLKDFKNIKEEPAPESFNCTMRDYQLAGYQWFMFLKHYGFGGCLADDMGLGKTVQTIALLLREKQSKQSCPSLVVVPTSLLFNWINEIQKFAPAIRTLLYHGPKRHNYKDLTAMADVVITSYGTMVRDLNQVMTKKFNYLILDEAQAIKNPTSQVSRAIRQIKAKHKLALSGTPIENNLSELWSLFTFLNPGMLGSFRSFAKNFIKPIMKDLNENTTAVLRQMIHPFILRRTKEQVAKELPPKSEVILYTEMLPEQKMLYDITRDTYRGKIIDSIENSGIERGRFEMLEGLMRLRQICCHPSIMNKSFSEESGKFNLLEEVLSDIVSGGHRVLIFSQFVKALELIRVRLAQQGISTELLTGQTRNREKVVDRFQNRNSAPVFLISLKAGGTGLNLTNADYVVHLDPWWNPSAENQASDRAYRIGQTKPVFVYKIITKDSVEERVLELQNQKKELVNSIITTESSFAKNLSKEDIIGLFS
ncbi:SNF2-related protein [Chitinispirillales bacterium ANBcel5]|uniref:SNF2-related protein n=1 Tax=Cellulosispirillum alkaliphilum TaxID=3039283 RepID=UPI002A539173|nr:SNF2-related protein [Chitinispirillales bacterium ANBcel5]